MTTRFFDDLRRWQELGRAIRAGGGVVRLEHDARWIRQVEDHAHWFVAVHGTEGPVAGVPASRLATLSLPGHYRLRVVRFGHDLDGSHARGLLVALRELVEDEPRLLSVHVEVFEPEADRREATGEIARELGFRRSSTDRSYRWTARVDLTPSEDEIFGGFSRSCRRSVREPERKGLRVEPFTDARWGPRMDRLWKETFARTGALAPARDWARRLAFAEAHPELVRFVGTFDPARPGDESLVAFACGMNQGDYAVYSDGASAELDSRVPLSYTPVWELMRWARGERCTWFDMGGVSLRDGGATEGITEFKLRFADDVVEVGAEWVYAPASIRSWIAEGARRIGRSFRWRVEG